MINGFWHERSTYFPESNATVSIRQDIRSIFIISSSLKKLESILDHLKIFLTSFKPHKTEQCARQNQYNPVILKVHCFHLNIFLKWCYYFWVTSLTSTVLWGCSSLGLCWLRLMLAKVNPLQPQRPLSYLWFIWIHDYQGIGKISRQQWWMSNWSKVFSHCSLFQTEKRKTF